MIAHLVHWELEQGGTLREAVLRAIPQLRGAYGTVIMDSRDPSTLLAARSGSPMVIGLGMGKTLLPPISWLCCRLPVALSSSKKAISRK